jgi:hypothetical protein
LSETNSQLSTIRLAISLLFKPGDLIEYRVKRAEEGWRGFYYNDHEKLAETVNRLNNDPRVVASYYVINPIRPSLPRERGITVNPDAATVDSIVDGPTQQLTKNTDIDTLNWMFIDVDTIRAVGFEHDSSTAEEKAATKKVAISVLEYLEEKGWPQPLLGDSGNGYHILCRVNMMNSDHNIHMLVDCLKALAKKFDSPAATIDAAVFNASRLTRAYGSTTRKGKETPERPYRRNRLIPPTNPIAEVSIDQILVLGSEIPMKDRRGSDDQPELVDGFDAGEWIDWYAKQGAFTIEGQRETNGMTVMVTDTCLTAGHKHSGSGLTGFIIGDTFGWHCFSDDCEGCTIGTVFKILREAVDENGKPKYEPFPGQVFKDEGLEAVLEGIEEGWIELADDSDAKAEKREEQKLDEVMAPRPESPAPNQDLPEWNKGSDALDGLDIICNDLATHMLSVIFHHPTEVWQDGFIHFVKRIKNKLGFDKKWKKPEDGEAPQQTLKMPIGETLRLLIKFTETYKRLPDKVAFKHFLDVSTNPDIAENQFKDEVKVWVDGLTDQPANTFDITAIALMDKLDLRGEINAVRETFNYFLLRKHDIQGARLMLKKHFNISTSQDTAFEQGAWQDRTEAIYADFEKNIRGVGDSRKFTLGFGSIDKSGMNIGLDGDHAICLCGPASNRKTTAALSIAMNFAITGKNGLFFAGEHQCMKVLKRLTLQLSHFFKNDPEIGSIPGLSKWEGLKRTATDDDLGKVKNLLLKLKAGDDVPGFIEPQNIGAVTQGDDDKVGAILAYAEATYAKYQWDFIVIDPLDSIMPPEIAGARGVSNWKLCSGIVDRLFDFSRNAFGGKGCMVVVTAQFGSDARRDIERIQEKNSGMENYDDELESILKRDGLIQYFTTIGQRFDLCLGVATRTKDGSEGLIVRGRDREGGVFNSCTFHVDPDTNYMTEKPRQYAKIEEIPQTMAASASYEDVL